MKNGMEARIRQFACAGAVALIGMSALAANPNPNQAVRMYNRIAGVPPSPSHSATVSRGDSCDPSKGTASTSPPFGTIASASAAALMFAVRW